MEERASELVTLASLEVETRERLERAIREAHAGGLSVRAIAGLTGWNRERVRRLVARESV